MMSVHDPTRMFVRTYRLVVASKFYQACIVFRRALYRRRCHQVALMGSGPNIYIRS